MAIINDTVFTSDTNQPTKELTELYEQLVSKNIPYANFGFSENKEYVVLKSNALYSAKWISIKNNRICIDVESTDSNIVFGDVDQLFSTIVNFTKTGISNWQKNITTILNRYYMNVVHYGTTFMNESELFGVKVWVEHKSNNFFKLLCNKNKYMQIWVSHNPKSSEYVISVLDEDSTKYRIIGITKYLTNVPDLIKAALLTHFNFETKGKIK